jgi:ribosomal protein S18 acetylase RimI-like enzyme
MSDKIAVSTRKATTDDFKGVGEVYRAVAKTVGGIARTEAEITDEYVRSIIDSSLKKGMMIVAEARGGKLCGIIHAYKPGLAAFSHVFSDLTIAVHPKFQGKGVGRLIFSAFLEEIKQRRPDILRVELIVRESNLRGLLLYETLGFAREGRLENRIKSVTGEYEADISMAWFNPNFK